VDKHARKELNWWGTIFNVPLWVLYYSAGGYFGTSTTTATTKLGASVDYIHDLYCHGSSRDEHDTTMISTFHPDSHQPTRKIFYQAVPASPRWIHTAGFRTIPRYTRYNSLSMIHVLGREIRVTNIILNSDSSLVASLISHPITSLSLPPLRYSQCAALSKCSTLGPKGTNTEATSIQT
jgi:hypothetical protein